MSEEKSVVVANQAGLYENFTGVIDWHGTKGEVENATFELSSKGHYVYWHDGIWNNGTMIDAIWWKGTWKNGTLIGSWWWRGAWKNGICKNTVWEYGIWHKGVFEDSVWRDGTWMNGLWKSNENKWYSGSWWKGTWSGGWWNLGIDKGNQLHYENDSPDKWNKKKVSRIAK